LVFRISRREDLPEGGPENSPAIYRREEGWFAGLSSEGTAEHSGPDISAVPAGLRVSGPGFPAINRRAMVGCSYGTSLDDNRHVLAVGLTVESLKTSPTFNHTPRPPTPYSNGPIYSHLLPRLTTCRRGEGSGTSASREPQCFPRQTFRALRSAALRQAMEAGLPPF
jgi:hypothetical protein